MKTTKYIEIFFSLILLLAVLQLYFSKISYEQNKTSPGDDLTPQSNYDLPRCPEKPPALGPLPVYYDSPSVEELDKLFPNLEPGGKFQPQDCKSRHRIAIIIPYRKRNLHLQTFLKNMHPFLQRQQLDYAIFVVEQEEGTKFNRALLLNIGYAEAIKLYDFQCFAFHDVDLLPTDDRNIYNCPNQPRHLSVAIDKYYFRLHYKTAFGGAVILTREQFEKINGYSNKFFGWGGEDDDFWNRVKDKGYTVLRYPTNISRYVMIKHDRDNGNEDNPLRWILKSTGQQRYNTDGINSLKYKLLKLEFRKLFTRIYVSVDEDAIMKNVDPTKRVASQTKTT